MGYGLIQTEDSVQHIINHFYKKTIGPYWDKERVYVDEAYQTIPFPFEEIETPDFSHRMEWTFSQLLGYLNTWSAVKLYEKEKLQNPIFLIEEELKKAWGAENTKQTVTFPILLRVGRL